MSSECRCHLNESCFYCEVYSPLVIERDRFREGYEKCTIGGNSLASVLVGWDLPKGWHNWSYSEANTYFYEKYPLDHDIAYEKYETWLCWKAIREAGELVEGVEPK